MELDTKLRFGKIHASSQVMWEQLLEIQRCILSGTRSDSWARHLRLLYVPGVAQSMINGRAVDDVSSVLYLCEQSQLPDETNYLSISYCWSSSANSQRSGSYTIVSNTGRRKSRAPDHVILSALNYCQAHQIPYIWIDQECINQDQVDDKELGINSMDMVYLRSAATVGVLTSIITQQRHLSALGMLLLDDPPNTEKRISNYPTSWDNDVIHQLMHSAHEILEILAADRWFTRLWTHQERAVSGQHFSVLLQYASGLKCPNAIGVTPGYVEINLERLAKSIAQCNRLDRRTGLSKCGEHPWKDKVGEWGSIWSQYVRSRQLVLDMDLDRYSVDDNDPTEARLTVAARILGEMELRDNEFVTDRLAIMANMCGYTCRLDTRAVSNRGWGFSTSALAMCLLNGELPLFDLDFGALGGTLAEYLCRCHPICGLGPVDQSLLGTFRLRDVKLTPRGIQSRGWLWEITRKICLSDLKEKYAKWNWYGATQRPHSRNRFPALKDAKVPVGVFMRDLWLSLKANGLEKLAMKIQQSLEDIWLNDEEPEDSIAMEIEFGATLEPIKAIPAPFSADIIPGLCESHVHLTVWMLFWQVVTHGEIWAAHISGTTEELGLFTSSGTAKVLTSCKEDTSSGSSLRWEKYVSIEVLQDSNYPPEDGMLLGCGWLSWMNGLWYPDGAEMKTYTIPLFPDDPKKQFWERGDHFATKASLPAAATEIPW